MLANLTANNVRVDSEQQLWEVTEKVWHKLCTAAYVKQLFKMTAMPVMSFALLC